MDANHTILDNALPTSPPRRTWLPVLCLGTTFVIWYWPRLTPTFFPNALDIAAVVILLPTSFLIARTTSLPGWVFVAFGASGVMLFLLANFNNNNFADATEGNSGFATLKKLLKRAGMDTD